MRRCASLGGGTCHLLQAFVSLYTLGSACPERQPWAQGPAIYPLIGPMDQILRTLKPHVNPAGELCLHCPDRHQSHFLCHPLAYV